MTTEPTFNGHTAEQVAALNPDHAIRGWYEGAVAYGDTSDAAVLEQALLIQAAQRKAASKPVQGSAEMHTARALTDNALATRLDHLRENRRTFPKPLADAFLEEAARRLRWYSTGDSVG